MPRLLILQGPDKGVEHRLADGAALPLGRASKLLPLNDSTVSRRHAEVKPSVSGRGWMLEDLRSANGTYLNNKRIERPTRLKDGDQIRLGGTVMIWDGAEDKELLGSGAAQVEADLIDLEDETRRDDASIINTVGSADDSMILASPAAAEAVRSWRVMSTLLEAAGRVLSPRELGERVLDALYEAVPVDRGFVLLKDPESGRFETEVVRFRDEAREQDKIRASKTIVDHVISQKEGILCSNAMSDSRFREGGGESMQAIGLRSVICAPIVAGENVLGIVYVDCTISTHIYTEEQLRLVAALGRMAGLAIENGRLVSQRVRTERLAAAGETVAALSHYIKNILQGMKGGSDIVEMGLREGRLATIDQGWEIVQRNLEKVSSLTMNMLAFAKRREPRRASVQITALIEDVLNLVKRRAEDRGVLIQRDIDRNIPAIPLDEDGIHQVCLNIVVNAIDAVERSTGVVNVRARYDEANESLEVTIGDNGPGIPEDIRERIFDAFYSTKGHAGTGLGLAVAKKIISEHGGTITADSIQGQGTLVRIRLPVGPGVGLDSAATHGPARE